MKSKHKHCFHRHRLGTWLGKFGKILSYSICCKCLPGVGMKLKADLRMTTNEIGLLLTRRQEKT